MIEIKILDVDIFALPELSKALNTQEIVTYKFLPVTDKNGRILACDSQMGDIAIQVTGFLSDQSVGLSLGLLVNWLAQQVENKNVGIFFTIGTQRINSKTITEEEIREIVRDELSKIESKVD